MKVPIVQRQSIFRKMVLVISPHLAILPSKDQARKCAISGSPGRGGRLRSTLWGLFEQSERKQNVSHYTMEIKPKGVTGKAEDMRLHLIKCQHASPNLTLDAETCFQKFVSDNLQRLRGLAEVDLIKEFTQCNGCSINW